MHSQFIILTFAFALTSAQLATEIADGQVQAPTSPIPIPTPTPAPAPAPAAEETKAAPAPPAAQPAPVALNNSLPAPAPAPAPEEAATAAPVANISTILKFASSTCTGTGSAIPPAMGNNATAPTVPAIVNPVAAPTEEGGPREAGTTTSPIAQATGGGNKFHSAWFGVVGGLFGLVGGVML